MRSVGASSPKRPGWPRLLLLLSCPSPQTLMSTPLLDPSTRPYVRPATAAGTVSSSLMTSRWALRPVSLPLFWPEEDWSRGLNCRPPLPVLSPASSSARCSWGASWRNIDSVSGFSTVKCDVTWPLLSTLMRTSMRPRSAGSSRISKLVLPLLADAAISIASPLTGTGALVAAVTLRGPRAAVVAAAGSCGWTAAVAWRLVSEASVGVWAAAASCEWSWDVGAAAAAGEALAAAASAFVASAPADGLAAPAACAAFCDCLLYTSDA